MIGKSDNELESETGFLRPHLSVVLDPTGLYEIPSGYIPITTEVEWMEFFGVSSASYWVKGKRLCDWAIEWLRVWNLSDAISLIKSDPSIRLQNLFHPLPLPQNWTSKQIFSLVTLLDDYPQENPIAYLLANITSSDRQIWLTPSREHLAAWLAIQVPFEYKPLERVWQNQFQDHDLGVYYQEDKDMLLRRWLGIAQPVMKELGMYPLAIPDFLIEDFDRYWEEELYRTEGKAFDNLIPSEQVGMERIASIVNKVWQKRPNWIDKVREIKVSPYLNYEQKLELSNRRSLTQPEPLALDASPSHALTWVTQNYLPFRRWEIQQSSHEEKISDQLADSFVTWILKHYPMMVASVDNSALNYNVASIVRNLCQSGPVLWVVVDGLGWLDHIELLSFLTENDRLAIEKSIEPRFSILPTKTEYAKWSLFAQLLPSLPYWVNDINKGFEKMGMGKRYTDKQLDKLYAHLRKKAHQLYCWDTEVFDHLYHTQNDWQSLYTVERPHTLAGIAKKIHYCLQQYPDPDNLRIVIASDRGQMMGRLQQISHCPPELEAKGRMAIGRTDDSQFVVLERDRYGLPYDISIVRGSASLGSFNYTSNKKIIGSHGGLFPEEVVVGVSILRKSIQRCPVIVSCHGKGDAGKPGELEMIVDNPNSVPLTDLYLHIHELPSLDSTKPLGHTIPANKRLTLKVLLPEVPELPLTYQGNSISLGGKLTFRFGGGAVGSANLLAESRIIVNQIYTSGINIDEFL